MEFNIKPGLKHAIEQEVEFKDTAARYESGLVEVFATPAMIALMEKTCMDCVQSLLPDGFGTVGFEVNIRHVKATHVGMKVKCLAELIESDDRKLTFKVNVDDEEGQAGTGTHIRYIIDREKFMKKYGKPD